MRIAMVIFVVFSMLACGDMERSSGDGSGGSINHEADCVDWGNPPEGMEDALPSLGYLQNEGSHGVTPSCTVGGVSLYREHCEDEDDPSDMYYACNPPRDSWEHELERVTPCLWTIHATMKEGECSYQAACIPEEHWGELEGIAWDDAVEQHCATE